MIEDEQFDTSIKSLLEDIVANQHSLHATLSDLYEKVQAIELQLGAAPPEDEYALDEAVDALYDQACACAETGVYISVPYLIRELQTNAVVAHELIERLRIDGLLDSRGSDSDDEDVEADVFTTIDLRDINEVVAADAVHAEDSPFTRARAFVVRERVCSQAALGKALGISQASVRAVLEELEAAGVVSEAKGRKGRTVLVTE